VKSFHGFSEGQSDAHLVINAVDPLCLLDEDTKSYALIGGLDKTANFDNAVAYREINTVVVDPGLRSNPIVQLLMQSGVANPLGHLRDLDLAQRANEIASSYNPNHAILLDDWDSLDASSIKNVGHISEFRILPDRDHIAAHNIVRFKSVRLDILACQGAGIHKNAKPPLVLAVRPYLRAVQ